MESAEYLPPRFGSLLQIIKVVFSGDYIKRALTNLQTAFGAEAEASLERVQTERIDNIVKLSAALKDLSNACLLAGKLLGLKVTIDGESYIIVQEITDEFREQLIANPLLMRDPPAIYRMLKKDQDDLNNQQNLMTG